MLIRRGHDTFVHQRWPTTLKGGFFKNRKCGHVSYVATWRCPIVVTCTAAHTRLRSCLNIPTSSESRVVGCRVSSGTILCRNPLPAREHMASQPLWHSHACARSDLLVSSRASRSRVIGCLCLPGPLDPGCLGACYCGIYKHPHLDT